MTPNPSLPTVTVAEAQDVFIAALCVWREMRGESAEARLACYWVIKNRATDMLRRWPRTWYGVVTEAEQFSSFNKKDPNSSLMPKKIMIADWQAWLEISAIVDSPGADPTGGANSYEALPDGEPRPGWAAASKMVKQIGKTRFYKL